MLNFICGRSGSGKTTKIIEMIKECVDQKKRTYFLVPEQQAFISESMLAFLPPSSALHFEVISFSRLCDIVFSKYGGVVRDTEDGIRNLVMWKTLRELKSNTKNEDKRVLKEYNDVKIDSSLTSVMPSTIDELRACDITAEKCRKAADCCTDPRLKSKLNDVELIYAQYNGNLASLPDTDAYSAEIKLTRLTELLEEHKS
jgi:ATP-dependent helicase/nuclease subunit B